MGFWNLLSLTLANLTRHKGRVFLTAIGVVIGTSSVVILISTGIGMQRNATQQLMGIGELTQIEVRPNYGDVGYGYLEIQVSGGGGSSGTLAGQKLITEHSIGELAGLPGVAGVFVRDYLQVPYMLKLDRLEGYSQIIGVRSDSLEALGLTAASGSLQLERGTAIAGSNAGFNFFDPRARSEQGPPPLQELQDRTLRLTLMKWNQQDGTEIRKSILVRVVGVLNETRGEPDYSLFIPLEDLEGMSQWFTGRRVNRNRDGYPMAIVKVEDVAAAPKLAEAIVDLGYHAYTPQSFIQGITSFFIILQVVFGGVGAIALLVAAIGIANTMTTAILERTREIGLMKAVGGTSRDIIGIFLAEAAGIGLFGGILGSSFGWAAGQALNIMGLVYMAGQSSGMGGQAPSVAVFTPLWLPPAAAALAACIGMLSGLYPALHASSLEPVEALRYE